MSINEVGSFTRLANHLQFIHRHAEVGQS